MSIAVVGSGLLAWMAALALGRLVPTGCSVTVAPGPEGHADSLDCQNVAVCGPEAARRMVELGMDPVALARDTEASGFAGWRTAAGLGLDWGFGKVGQPLLGLSFVQVWRAARESGDPRPFPSWRASTLAAGQGRFAWPDLAPALAGHSGFVFSSQALRAALRSQALARGVLETPSVAGAAWHINASGARDAPAVSSSSGRSTAPLGEVAMTADAVMMDVALPSGSVLIAIPPLSLPKADAAETSWIGHTIGLGDVAGQVHPLFLPAFDIAVADLADLLCLLPLSHGFEASAVEYRRLTRERRERWREFQTLAMSAPVAPGAVPPPEWPEPLRRKCLAFARRARLPTLDHEGVPPDAWREMLLAKGWLPSGTDQLAAHLTAAEVKAALDALAEDLAREVAATPLHDAQLSRESAA